MTKGMVGIAAMLAAVALPGAGNAQGAPCLVVTLTGTQSGPPAFNGLAQGEIVVGTDLATVRLPAY